MMLKDIFVMVQKALKTEFDCSYSKRELGRDAIASIFLSIIPKSQSHITNLVQILVISHEILFLVGWAGTE